MTGAKRASVRPRVISPETGDALPLEDVLADLQGVSSGAVEIVGDIGSGKTTALEHLAAVMPPDRGFVFLDDATLAAVAEAAGKAIVVFTSAQPRAVPGATSYPLAPWDRDDVTEYLLTEYPRRCRSILARLQMNGKRLRPGPPELWRIVLDRMADDESVLSVSEALREELEDRLPDAGERAMVAQHCLEMLTGRIEEAEA